MAFTATTDNYMRDSLMFEDGRPVERVKLTGATGIVGDTAVFRPRFIKTIDAVEGPVNASPISNGQTTLTLQQAIGNGVTIAKLFAPLNGGF